MVVVLAIGLGCMANGPLRGKSLVARRIGAVSFRYYASAEYVARGSIHLVMPSRKHVPSRVTAFRDLVLELLRRRPM